MPDVLGKPLPFMPGVLGKALPVRLGTYASGALKGVLTLPAYCPDLISSPKVTHIGVQNPKQPQDSHCTLATTAAAAVMMIVILTTFHFPAHDQPGTRRTSLVSPEQPVLCIPIRPTSTTAACCTSCIVVMQVQQLLLEGAWSDKVLALPGCGPALSSSMEVVWVGPRARMGISEAIPSRVVPHTTSGRADYFGPLVNRYMIRHVGM